jgi:hypothetical protein
MFATQHYMETFSDVPKKRGREDGEELGTGALSFSEHRNVSDGYLASRAAFILY